ncbi:DUF1292 domain-containing protein [Clostridium polynesiense]|uniref:DUF1292 domain-containing protein n=1 Tax=Clostridium polynesiense TaxID=1325933 RepID=UPI00058F348A|nr:DUF1292 domain-containing protein [Clostridium polynesiense]
MTVNSIMAFRDEKGNRIEYKILDELIVNKAGYLIMSPINNSSSYEFYKLKFDKHMNEQLLSVDDNKEIEMIKKASHINFKV